METPMSEERSRKERVTTLAAIAGFVVLLLLAYAAYGWAFYHIGKWVLRII